jgi:O-antigen ligase
VAAERTSGPPVFTVVHFLLVGTLAWGGFAFGAVYPWAYWPLVTASTVTSVIALSVRWSGARSRELGALAAAFPTFLAAGLIQIVPLSLSVLETVSPESLGVISQLDLLVGSGAAPTHPISISPGSTTIGLILFASNALLILGCARLFSIVGARRIAEAIAVLGVAMALVGVGQSGLVNGKIYGFWTPLDGGSPFGPFVNRNHFAGWMLLALPLTLGLVCGGIARGTGSVRPFWHDRLMWLSSSSASRLVLLGSGAIVMGLSLAMTMSRSAMSALGLSIVLTGAFALRRQQRRRGTMAVAYLVLLVVVIVGWTGTDAIASRFSQTNWSEFNDRRGAWADAIDIASRFPATGTGLNTYGIATLFYQRHDLSQHYSQAHNDLLQLAAEGGLLLTIPALACIGLLALKVRQKLNEETSTRTYWLRVGAATSLVAIAFQEMVDFSLQMPGNAALFAVVCAIAIHTTPPRSPRL